MNDMAIEAIQGASAPDLLAGFCARYRLAPLAVLTLLAFGCVCGSSWTDAGEADAPGAGHLCEMCLSAWLRQHSGCSHG